VDGFSFAFAVGFASTTAHSPSAVSNEIIGLKLTGGLSINFTC
jgi:hypothetical protein